MQNHIFTDQLNREVSILYPPMHIISLVPSQTELLFELGLDNEIVGITKFCIHPRDKTKQKAKIGGTKALDQEKIKQLNPDLIIGNKEENEKDQIESLAKEYPVWMSNIYTIEDALEMIEQIGKIVNREQNAKSIVTEITSAFNSMHNAPAPLRIAYFIWKNPYMVAANDTFIDHIINTAGWQNAITASRYPEISPEELRKVNPDVILLSSEPYPFKEKHIKEFQEICPEAPVIIVDGELFSWYGSRLQYTPAYLQQLQKQIHDLKSSAKSF